MSPLVHSPRLLWSLCLLVGLSACDNPHEQIAHYLQQGKQFYKSSDLAKAREAFDHALAVEPDNLQIHFELAEALSQLGDMQQAVNHYQQVATQDAKHLPARIKLAQIYLAAGELAAAEKMAKEALSLDAENIDAMVLQGRVLSAENNTDAAFVKAEAALRKNPGDPSAVLLMATLNAKTGKIGAAIESLEAYIGKHADNIAARLALANGYTQQQQREKAGKQLEDIVKLEPKQLEHRKRWATFLINSQQLDKAETVLRSAMTDLPDQEPAKLMLIDFLVAHRKPEVAIAELLPMIEQHSDFYRLRFRLAELQLMRQQRDNAEETLQEIVNLDKRGQYSAKAQAQLARIYRLTGRDDRAKALVDGLLAENANNFDALTLRGEMALTDRRVADAITDFRSVLAVQPNNIQVLKLLGAAHVLNKDGVLARENIEKILALAPQDESARLDLVNLLLQAGDREQASRQLNTLFKLNPNSKQGLEALARIHLASRQWEQALQVAKQLETLHANDAVGFYLSGLAYQAQNKLDLSNARFEQALQKQEQAVEPLRQWIKNLLAAKQFDQALAKLHDVLKKQPGNFFAHNLLGDVYSVRGKYNDAIQAYQQAIAVKALWAAPYRSLARVYVQQKNNAEAIASLIKGLEQASEPLELVTDLAAVYHVAGEGQKTIALYQEWHKKHPDSLSITHNLARYLADYGASPEALADAAKLIEPLAKANDAQMLDTAAWLAYRLADYDRSRQLLSKALALNPGDAISHYHLGMVCLKQNDREQALHHLQQAIDNKQDFYGRAEAQKALNALGKPAES